MNSYTRYLSAFRGSRAKGDPKGAPPEVGGPVGATSSMTAKDEAEMTSMRAGRQSKALRGGNRNRILAGASGRS